MSRTQSGPHGEQHADQQSSDPSFVSGLDDVAAADVVFGREPDPFRMLAAWYREALSSEPNDANAMALATVDEASQPNVRIVLLKGIDPKSSELSRGLIFYTNLESAKGRELKATPSAAIVLHWKSLGRQIRARGRIEQVSAHDADAYFKSRPRGSQVGAWASQQSRPLDDRVTLQNAVQSLGERYDGSEIPRPDFWSGFRLVPAEFEFWQAGQDRLHDRFKYTNEAAPSRWRIERLWP